MIDLDYAPKRLKILQWPNDEALHEQCEDVTEFDDRLLYTIHDMLYTMLSSNGIGLAAPQVGILQRLITIQIEPNKPLVLINPEIVEASEELFVFNEGCLSVPGYFEDRKRPARIVVKFQDEVGNHKEFEFRDLYAFCIQHEIDHLNGKVFVDGLSSLKTMRIKAKIKKYLKRK
jgi:peptide deformylase